MRLHRSRPVARGRADLPRVGTGRGRGLGGGSSLRRQRLRRRLVHEHPDAPARRRFRAGSTTPLTSSSSTTFRLWEASWPSTPGTGSRTVGTTSGLASWPASSCGSEVTCRSHRRRGSAAAPVGQGSGRRTAPRTSPSSARNRSAGPRRTPVWPDAVHRRGRPAAPED